MPRDVALTRACVTVGRSEDAQIFIESNLMSRHGPQGAFLFEAGAWSYVDLGSVNGTYVDGVLLTAQSGGQSARVPLHDGSVLDVDAAERGAVQLGVRMCLRKGAPGAYHAHRLPQSGQVLIGRSKQSDIQLPSIAASQRHAVLHCGADGDVIESLPSSSGLFLNGVVLRGRARLTPRDILSIGGTVFMYAPGVLYRQRESVPRGGVVLSVRNVTRTEKGKLNKVSFDVHQGELVAIIGGSGAGKSTLLNAISGSVRPHSGTVLYHGSDLLAYHDVLKSQIGFVPQKDIMHQQMTLGDMLSYAARLRLPDDVSAQEREERVERVMKELSIDGARDTSLLRVSGGQRKRASIGIEMLSDPDLFFLDEPTSGLDPGTEHHLMQTLRELTDKGKTVVLVTHTTLTLPICDKIIVMGNGGQLCYYGPPQEAASFFGVRGYVEIFDLIQSPQDAAQWAQRFRQTRGSLEKAGGSEAKKTVRAHFSRTRQMITLTSRYLRLILNQPFWLAGMMACVPFLAWVVSLVATEDLFVTYANTYKTLFTLICAPVFVGLLTAHGEICKERDILYREYTANLSLGAYLMSKWIAMLLINAVQSVILTLCFCLLVEAPTRSLLFSPVVEMGLTLFLTLFSASCLGLLVSAVSPSRNIATSLLSVLLVPQVVFSGAVFELEGMTRSVANVIHAFWGTNCLAISTGMENLDMKSVTIEKGIQAGMKFTAATPQEDYLTSTVPNLFHSWGMLVVLALACTALCYGTLRLTATRYKD